MTQDLTTLKPFLEDYVRSVTTRSKNGLYNCPLCPSGTGAHKTGAFSITKDGQRWKCFSCNRGGDIFDLCAEIENCSPSEAAKNIMSKYGGAQIGGSYRRSTAAEDFKPTPEARQDQAEPPRTFAEEIARYAEALPGSAGQSYLEGRGLILETMKRFNLGYNAAKKQVTIPYNQQGSYYGQRSVNAQSLRPHDNLQGVSMPLFNAAALYSSDVCFIVESPLCAISIAQAGGAAVAVSGVPAGNNRLLKQLKSKPTTAALIICYDNDVKGREATEALAPELESLGAFCVNGTAAIMGDCTDAEAAEYRKDPNECLQKNGAEALKEAVTETIEATRTARNVTAQEAEQERKQRTGAGMVDSFLEAIQSRKYEPMPTGITDIDRAIGGGFIRQQLVLLGAAPGAGKTALAQWIFEGMAKRGTACVYLNLEMSREQVLARSFSRLAARNGDKVRTTDILQGYRWTDAQRAAIMRAAEEYKQEIAPRMIYNPDGITANLDEILSYIEKEAQTAEAAQMTAPLVVLDYLQLVSGQPREDTAGVIKRAVAGLKSYAVRHNTLVFVIIAHNRLSNSSGAVSMESGRDTSALEYSADLQLALTFTLCLKREGQKQKTPDELTPEEKQQVTLKVTKGRFGGAGTEVDLLFNGETMTYSQIAREFTEVHEPTPFDEPTQTKQMRF